MLRALRQLAELRAPDSFRPWLAAITVRQVSTHLQREQLIAGRTTALDEAAELPDPDANLEGVALLRAELSGQRRQAVRASRWLDAEDRALLSLWWLEPRASSLGPSWRRRSGSTSLTRGCASSGCATSWT